MVGALIGMGLMSVSCNDELDLYPEDYFSGSSFWNSQTEFEGFITAISNQFRSNYPANILFYAGELRAGGFELVTIDGSGSLNTNVIQNIYDETNCQFSTFGGYYGFIANLNEFIYRCAETTVLTDETKNGLLAMAYGWRAYVYFQMYRMYGGVVLRLEPDVILGEYNATELYKGRATAEETLTQIKSDIKTSLELFNNSSYTYSSQKDYYWSKAATEMLAGEVYLWSGKVSTDDHTATPEDVTTAATYFNNVINNYGYQLQPDYFSVWTTPHNSESIYSICYTDENDGVYYTYPSYYLLWARTTGAAYTNYWSTQDQEGWGHIKGVANRFGKWYDPSTGESSDIDIWGKCNFGPMRYLYKNALYFQYDEEDSRINMFYPQWGLKEEERTNNVAYIEDFDPTQYELVLVHSYVNSVLKSSRQAPIIHLPMTCRYTAWLWPTCMWRNAPTIWEITPPWNRVSTRYVSVLMATSGTRPNMATPQDLLPKTKMRSCVRRTRSSLWKDNVGGTCAV